MDVPRIKAAPAGHIPALDGVRGIAILAVLIFHFSGPLARNFDGFPQKLVGAGFRAGWVGVDLFFVLSGFLITRNLLSLSGSTSDRITLFWRNRALRIFPIYFVFLFIYALAVYVPPLPYWLYYCNWTQPYQPGEIRSPLSHFWSLAVEEQFYVVWPVVALLLPRTQLLACSWAVVIIVPALRTTAVAFEISPHLIYRATIFRVDALVLGALIAQGVGWRAPLFIGAALTIPVILICKGFAWPHPLMQTLGYTGIAACFAGFVGWAATTSAPIISNPSTNGGLDARKQPWQGVRARRVHGGHWARTAWKTGSGLLPAWRRTAPAATVLRRRSPIAVS